MSEKMSKADRAELKTLLTRRTKMHRADVDARVAEMNAEANQRLAADHEAEDHAREELKRAIRRLTDDANRQAIEMIQDHLTQWPAAIEVMERGGAVVACSYLNWNDADRKDRRRQISKDLDVLRAQALERIERAEVDLREELVRQSVDTDAAASFLERIPRVGELVPASRLNELLAAEEA